MKRKLIALLATGTIALSTGGCGTAADVVGDAWTNAVESFEASMDEVSAHREEARTSTSVAPAATAESITATTADLTDDDASRYADDVAQIEATIEEATRIEEEFAQPMDDVLAAGNMDEYARLREEMEARLNALYDLDPSADIVVESEASAAAPPVSPNVLSPEHNVTGRESYTASHCILESVNLSGNSAGHVLVAKYVSTNKSKNDVLADTVDLIRNQGAAAFDQVQIWAVDGQGNKFISFTINQPDLQSIADGAIDETGIQSVAVDWQTL